MTTETAAQTLRKDILDMSRQNKIGLLSNFFEEMLEVGIRNQFFPTTDKIRDELVPNIIDYLKTYSGSTGISTVVLGMSGGVDSALTAALFKQAGWRVIGVTMPIDQNPDETNRGKEACEALGIEHLHKDLTVLYYETLAEQHQLDSKLAQVECNDKQTKIRRGNIRARLRMITLYNLASSQGGLVASTDNFSELAAGFWTLHGDVGDVSPIQALTKSWEVPYMARLVGVPESTYRAVPTDGLGIDAGDEAQLGCSYLEFDIMFYAIHQAYGRLIEKRGAEIIIHGLKDEEDPYITLRAEVLEGGTYEPRAHDVFDAVWDRISKTWFKRLNPVNIEHPINQTIGALGAVDRTFMQPKVVR